MISLYHKFISIKQITAWTSGKCIVYALLHPTSKALDCGWYYALCYTILYVHVSNE